MTIRIHAKCTATLVALALLFVLTPAHSGEPAPPGEEEVPPIADESIDESANTVPVLDATTSATPRYKPLTWKKHK